MPGRRNVSAALIFVALPVCSPACAGRASKAEPGAGAGPAEPRSGALMPAEGRFGNAGRFTFGGEVSRPNREDGLVRRTVDLNLAAKASSVTRHDRGAPGGWSRYGSPE
jgi:hypothetical protein